jgi:hypothetical protein
MIVRIIAALFAVSLSVDAAAAQNCNAFPYTLTNGQPADANQVMANFNYVANCVNSLAAANDAIVNCTLQASVASNNLTIALKANDGNDPSSTNPCTVSFRNAVATTGNYVVVQVTSAASIVLNAGSSLGTSNNQPFRIWIEAFNDGGTFRLAVSNQSTSTRVFPINEASAASATQCNACANATSAGVFYSPATVASKAIRILGYMEWGSGLTTAGNWSSGPTLIQLFGPGIKKPGDVVQKIYMTSTTQTSTSGTTPVVTAATISITPTSAANRIHAVGFGTAYSDTATVGALVQIYRNGSTAIGSIGEAFSGSGSSLAAVSLIALDAPDTISQTTYAVYLFMNTAGPAIGSFPLTGNNRNVGIEVEEIMGALEPANDNVLVALPQVG